MDVRRCPLRAALTVVKTVVNPVSDEPPAGASAVPPVDGQPAERDSPATSGRTSSGGHVHMLTMKGSNRQHPPLQLDVPGGEALSVVALAHRTARRDRE